ncbi:hypothetical protein [Sciscionella marina]|uniref:hypothetical protein n=1 Tax=Sciscionella marina TaxID=508770 RepID=UPI000366C374|nr:hypothetical protein [Sciscionella marina]
MNTAAQVTVAIRSTGGLAIYGTFDARDDAALTGEWLIGNGNLAFAVGLHRPDVDPTTARAIVDVTGEVIELPGRVALTLTDTEPVIPNHGKAVVSLLLRRPARCLALFIGPFATAIQAQAWIQPSTPRVTGDEEGTAIHIHPLQHPGVIVPTQRSRPVSGSATRGYTRGTDGQNATR